MADLIVAVDVGTGSARAGIFDRHGKQLARADYPIAMNRPEENHAEHDSENIWAAVCIAVKNGPCQGRCAAESIAAIGFDATCSLVVRDKDGAPLSVNRKGDPRWDTIVWLDHRALKQADFCTATEHPVLEPFGPCDVSGNGDAEADVAEAEPATAMGKDRIFLRSRRLHVLAGNRQSPHGRAAR
jgi:ribulose kinase